MNKILIGVLLGAAALYSTKPVDYLGAWDLNELPNSDSTFNINTGFEESGLFLKAHISIDSLMKVDAPFGGNRGVASITEERFLEIGKTNYSDSLFAYSLAFEFMYPDTIRPFSSLFRLGNIYSEGLVFSGEGKLGNWTFLYDEEPERSIVPNQWYQVVVSIKVGSGYDDTTSVFKLYINGVPHYDYKPSYYQDVSGGQYYPYQFNKSLFIDAPVISKVALFDKILDSTEVSETQNTFFNTVDLGEGFRKKEEYSFQIIPLKGLFMVRMKEALDGEIKVYSLNGSLLNSVKLSNGLGFVDWEKIPKGVCIFEIEAGDLVFNKIYVNPKN